jgi:hypothetical protein
MTLTSPRRTPLLRRTLCVAVPAVAGLAFLAPQVVAQGNSQNQNPKPSAVTLEVKTSPIVFGGTTELSGRVAGANVDGITIRFEQDNIRPYGDKYTATTLTAKTANNGRYSVAAKPTVNTSYRAIAQASPPVMSTARIVNVRTLVGIRVSDSTPRRGSLVKFSGSVFPAHDGSRALIQRRTSSGSWVTLARPALRDAGTLKSTYSKSLRVRSDGTYRVKVAGDGDHVNGFSRLRKLDVH